HGVLFSLVLTVAPCPYLSQILACCLNNTAPTSDQPTPDRKVRRRTTTSGASELLTGPEAQSWRESAEREKQAQKEHEDAHKFVESLLNKLVKEVIRDCAKAEAKSVQAAKRDASKAAQ